MFHLSWLSFQAYILNRVPFTCQMSPCTAVQQCGREEHTQARAHTSLPAPPSIPAPPQCQHLCPVPSISSLVNHLLPVLPCTSSHPPWGGSRYVQS